MASCGVSPRETRRMTLLDVNRVYRGWRNRPPTHRLVAAFMGVEEGGGERVSSEAEAEALMNQANRAARQGQFPRV